MNFAIRLLAIVFVGMLCSCSSSSDPRARLVVSQGFSESANGDMLTYQSVFRFGTHGPVVVAVSDPKDVGRLSLSLSGHDAESSVVTVFFDEKEVGRYFLKDVESMVLIVLSRDGELYVKEYGLPEF
jgi:hypothetical protein